MTPFGTIKLAVAFGASAGAAITAVLHLLGVVFWQQLVIALVTGVLTMAGVIIAAVIAARAAQANRSEIRKTQRQVGHVQSALGLDRREQDRQEAEPDA